MKKTMLAIMLLSAVVIVGATGRSYAVYQLHRRCTFCFCLHSDYDQDGYLCNFNGGNAMFNCFFEEKDEQCQWLVDGSSDNCPGTRDGHPNVPCKVDFPLCR